MTDADLTQAQTDVLVKGMADARAKAWAESAEKIADLEAKLVIARMEADAAKAELEAARAEHLLDLKEARYDRDNMKAWSVALYAHVCRLGGKSPTGGPAEIVALTKSYTAEWMAIRDADVAAAIDVTAGAVRALVLEEAARLVENGKEGWCDVSQIARDLRALAPLEPSLVVVEKETIAKVREALEQEHGGKYREPECPLCAALEALEGAR